MQRPAPSASAPRRSARRALRALPLLAACALLTGCGGEGGILGELWGLRLQDLLGAVLLYGVGGGVLGAAVGLVAFFALRAQGALRGEWRLAGALRGLTCALLLLGCGLCGGGVGACVGVVRGSDAVLRKSRLGTEVFPEAASALADLTFQLVKVAERRRAGDQDLSVEDEELAAFRAGKREVSLAQVQELSTTLQGGLSDQAVDDLTRKVLGDVPAEEKSFGRRLMEDTAKFLVRQLVASEVGKATKGGGLKKVARESMDLEAAAKRKEPAATLSHDELKEHYVDKLIVPFCLHWVEKSVFIYKLAFVVGVVLLPLLPLPGFWLLRRLFGDPAATPPADAEAKPEA